MNINKINANITAQNFTGMKNIKNENKTADNATVPVFVKVSPDKLTSALKAAVLIPAASLPLILGSCDKVEHCDEYWTEPGNGTSIKYPSIHILPEIKVDSMAFANDTVKIPKELSTESKINKALNNTIDTLKMPRLNEGGFPVVIAFKTPEYIQYMKQDGLASDNNEYIYDVQKFNKDGSVNLFKSTFTTSGDDLIMKNQGLDETSEYKFRTLNDTVQVYKNINGTFVKQSDLSAGDGKKYFINNISAQGDTTKIDNVTVFCVKPDYED